MQTLVFYKSVQINQLSIIYKKKKTNIELTTYNLNSSLKIIIMDVWSTMQQSKIKFKIDNPLQFTHVSEKIIYVSPAKLTLNCQLTI